MAIGTKRQEESSAKGDERYYRICRVSFIFGLIQHAILAFIFSHLEVDVLARYNIISMLAFTVAFLLNEKRRFYAALSIAYVEIVIHQILATVYIGWETGFHAFILFCIMLPLLTQRGHNFWKIFISGSSFLIYIVLFLLLRNATPTVMISDMVISTFAIINMLSFIFILVIIAYLFNNTVLDFEEKLSEEYAYAQGLLLNILPESITERLGHEKEPIADGIEEASVLFADIVQFTELADKTAPDRLVELLDHLFSKFDGLSDAQGCEKIKTIGDAYMVATGVPDSDDKHAEKLAGLAFQMLQAVDEFNREESLSIALRIGIHSGPLVAGVIGKRKFSYDLWGDTVNIASRMESSGVVGSIQVSNKTKELLGEGFKFEHRGEIQIKGKGNIETWILMPPV